MHHAMACSAELLARIAEKVESDTEARDYGWLVSALDQLKVRLFKHACCELL